MQPIVVGAPIILDHFEDAGEEKEENIVDISKNHILIKALQGSWIRILRGSWSHGNYSMLDLM